ncbi:MAG: AarF/ABC1/UbiB kinase family protein, partial [Deltaproteobacteria bacterium]|nr:AarF/ABC1/UbiB kinase family protein [Deltaproteobacteria bacterium]
MVSLVNAARDIGRVRDVTAVLARHGFGEVLHRMGFGPRRDDVAETAPSGAPWAVRLRLALEELGPTFVKLGQILSTRADVLPPELIAELTKLQDSVPPVPFQDIRAQIERTLGASLEDVFVSVEEAPLAAASIAQVHRGRLRLAEGVVDVAVKVQRPAVAATISSDLDLLHMLAALLERAVPESRVYAPAGLVRQFDRAITSELDFTAEAENAERFAQNFAGNPGVHFPRVHRSASGKHVLTLEFLDGCKVSEAVARGHSGKVLARIAIDLLVKQVFEDGFFHADPHPGNVLVLGPPEAPVIALIDLGMVGRL